jgi:hypothetical protein
MAFGFKKKELITYWACFHNKVTRGQLPILARMCMHYNFEMSALKAFLDDMVKALDESTAETNSKEEIKRQLSYIIREIDPLY